MAAVGSAIAVGLSLYCAATAFLAVGQLAVCDRPDWMVAAVYGVIYFFSVQGLLAKFTSDPPAAKGWK